jgi:hypothetical protein
MAMTSSGTSVATLAPMAVFVLVGMLGAGGLTRGGMVVGSGKGGGVVEAIVVSDAEGSGKVVVTIWVESSVTVVLAPSYTKDVIGTLVVLVTVTVATEGISLVMVAIDMLISITSWVVVAGTCGAPVPAGLSVVRTACCSLPMAHAGWRLSGGTWTVVMTVVWRVEVAMSFVVVTMVVTKLVEVTRRVSVLIMTEVDVVVDVVPVCTVDVAMTVLSVP